MREIKFRAFDTANENRGMYIPDELWQEDGRVRLIVVKGNTPLTTSSVILMQYTGLKDKNGKEIYEGDILSRKNPNYLYQVIWKENIVRWLGLGIFRQTRKDETGYHPLIALSNKPEKCKVIGNIYENPELIK